MNSYILIILVVVLIAYLYVRNYNSIYDKIYLDNNGTTQPHKAVVSAMSDAAYLGNPSTSYAWDAKLHLEKLQNKILKWVGFLNAKAVIMSGASEANNFVIRGAVDAAAFSSEKGGKQPAVVLSEIEHKTSLECAQQLEKEGRCKVFLVKPTIHGVVEPAAVHAILDKYSQDYNIVLVSIMAANNETGAINDIKSIAHSCVDRGIPFHTDAVQMFGKTPIPMAEWGISALSMSFHKMNGPMGIGACVMAPDFAAKMSAQIAGSQNDGLRGGTENVPAFAGANVAMDLTLNDREAKNARLRKMKSLFLCAIGESFDFLQYSQFAGKPDEGAIAMIEAQPAENKKGLVVIGPVDSAGRPIDSQTLPNTLMVSVVNLPSKSTYKPFCNMKLKSNLAADDVIISIGSACNTNQAGASHVIKAMDAPFIIRCGVVRISLGDYNTESQVRAFAKKFIRGVYLQ
jgi:cysteine desulfurase